MKTSGLPFEKCTLFLCGKYIFDQNKVQKKQEVIICYHFFDLLLDQLIRNQMRDAVRLYIFAGLSGCHTVKFLVHTVKYSLVRKTDLVHDLGNGKLRGAEQTPAWEIRTSLRYCRNVIPICCLKKRQKYSLLKPILAEISFKVIFSG